MKRILLLLCFIVNTSLTAQKIQWTHVREQNSQKKPIPAAQVIFEGSVPAKSDLAGSVRLAFAGKNAGQYVFLTTVIKDGYELVNNKEVEQVRLGDDDQLGVDIILARAGVVEAARIAYYEISDRALKAGFEREKGRLRKELEAIQLTAQQFSAEKEKLQQAYERQRKEIDVLAEKFARVNFDDVEPAYKEALALFKDGKIDDAIARLESADPARRTAQIIKEGQAIANEEKELAQRKLALGKEKQNQIKLLRLLADMYSVKFDPDKAERNFDDLMRLDSTDLDVLSEAAKFYSANHRYNKALRVLALIVGHPKTEDFQIAEAYLMTGDMHSALGNLNAALAAFDQATKKLSKLYNANPTFLPYINQMAISYSKHGAVYQAMGDLQQAVVYFQEYQRIAEQLCLSNPDNVAFKDNLAISYCKVGDIHVEMAFMIGAFPFYRQYNSLMKQLCDSFPENMKFKESLAISYLKYGNCRYFMSDYGRSLDEFKAYYNLEKELYTAFPNHTDYKSGYIVSNEKLAAVYQQLDTLDKALHFAHENNSLAEELCAQYPENPDFKNNLAVSYYNLGAIHLKLENSDSASAAYDKYVKLETELYTTHPDNANFQNGLAISYARLAGFYRDYEQDSATAWLYLFSSRNLLQRLTVNNTNYTEFSVGNMDNRGIETKTMFNGGSSKYSHNLGMINNQLTTLERHVDLVGLLEELVGEDHENNLKYLLYTVLCDTLRERCVSNKALKKDLADALNGRAWTGFFLQKFAAVEADIREGLALKTENKFLPTNLAPALLLQGKRKEALDEYRKWQDRPFGEQGLVTYRDAFLGDLKTFDEAGIIPSERMADVAAARALLEKK